MCAGITAHRRTNALPSINSRRNTYTLVRMISRVITAKRFGRRDTSPSGISVAILLSSVIFGAGAGNTLGAGVVGLSRRRIMTRLPAPLLSGRLGMETPRCRQHTQAPTPLKIMLTPITVPMTHPLFAGQVLQIRTKKISVTTPLKTSHADPPTGRNFHASANSRIACTKGRLPASGSAQPIRPRDESTCKTQPARR